jgi:ribosomal protein S30
MIMFLSPRKTSLTKGGSAAGSTPGGNNKPRVIETPRAAEARAAEARSAESTAD